jgi:hypothetical protein
MSRVTVRATGLAALQAALGELPDETIREAKKVVGQGALNIKRGTQRRWRGLAHLPHLPAAVTYDVTRSGSVISAEIGADRSRLQGKLAWIPEYGSPTSAPRPGLAPELDAEAPKFERYVEQLGVDVLEAL